MNLKKIVIKDIEQLGSNSYLDFDNEELYLYLSSIKNISEPQKLFDYRYICENVIWKEGDFIWCLQKFSGRCCSIKWS